MELEGHKKEVSKTVFFLGAGFSKPAGGPIQNELISTIFSEKFKKEKEDPCIENAYQNFVDFLKNGLYISETMFDKVPLEDVFTPIDRCIADGRTYRGYSTKQLVDLHDDLHLLLAKSIKVSIESVKESEPTNDSKAGNYIGDFARYVNELAKLKQDKVSILTTNWDTLLDNELNKLVRQETDNLPQHNHKDRPIAVVDYCCYISSLDENDDYIKPGLLALGRGGYNIKYLKLHGSMNWLHCPNCQRLYVSFCENNTQGEKKVYTDDSIFINAHCRHCQKNFPELKSNQQDSLKLRGKLLLPTFIKDLRDTQLQLIWQNAGIELSEADRIIFIGYSLPSADFEIRQLLSRFVRKDAEIQVVIYPNPDEDAKDAEIERYMTFFGNRINNKDGIIVKTVPDYINENLLSNIGKV